MLKLADSNTRTVMLSTVITVSHQFIAYHRWLAAPPEVDFLKNWHRHIFKVNAVLPVSHQDRDLEFFKVQQILRVMSAMNFDDRQLDMSCEMFAQKILCMLLESGHPCQSVTVSEDGENSATVMNLSLPLWPAPFVVEVPDSIAGLIDATEAAQRGELQQ